MWLLSVQIHWRHGRSVRSEKIIWSFGVANRTRGWREYQIKWQCSALRRSQSNRPLSWKCPSKGPQSWVLANKPQVNEPSKIKCRTRGPQSEAPCRFKGPLSLAPAYKPMTHLQPAYLPLANQPCSVKHIYKGLLSLVLCLTRGPQFRAQAN